MNGEKPLIKREKYFIRNEVLLVLSLASSLPILFITYLIIQYLVCYIREIPFPPVDTRGLLVISILWVMICLAIGRMAKKSR